MAYDPLVTAGLIEVHATYLQEHPISNFLRDFFFGNSPVMSKHRHVTIEVKKGGQKAAVAIRRGSQPKMMLATDGYDRSIYEPPYFADESTIGVEDLETLSFGESASAPLDSTTKTFMILAEKQTNIENQHERAKELQAAEVLLTGKVKMIDDSEIDYGIDTDLIGVNPTVKWDTANGTGVDILGDLQKWAMSVFTKSGVMPNSIVVTPDVHQLMLNNSAVQTAMDIRNFSLGTLTASAIPSYPGVTDGGLIMVSGIGALRIYTYASKYDLAGTPTNLLPAGTVIMANSNNMGRFFYAACIGKGTNGMPAYVPGESLVMVDKGDAFPYPTSVIVQMAPLAAPVSVDTWMSANVLVNAA